MWQSIKELRKELEIARRENERLDLLIRLKREEKIKAMKEAELERLDDPEEPAYNDECCPCRY